MYEISDGLSVPTGIQVKDIPEMSKNESVNIVVWRSNNGKKKMLTFSSNVSDLAVATLVRTRYYVTLRT